MVRPRKRMQRPGEPMQLDERTDEALRIRGRRWRKATRLDAGPLFDAVIRPRLARAVYQRAARRSGRGRASFTVRARPESCEPLRLLMA